MTDERPPSTRISAFVGRSFLDQDEPLWSEIRKILESLKPIGFDFEDAKEAQLRPISEKVRQGIERNDFYIGILTRRLPIGNERDPANAFRRIISALKSLQIPSRWTTSNWVIQESGFALGKGKKLLFLIEQGVDFPSADLDADTEWVRFDRNAIPQCSTRLVSMISRLISETLPIVPPTADVLPPQETSSPEQSEDSAPWTDFKKVMALITEGDFQKADEEFEKLMAMEPFRSDQSWRYFYLRRKSIKGDAASLQQLRSVVQLDPQNLNARTQLALYYRHFKDHSKAAKIFLDGAEIGSKESKVAMFRHAAEELAKDDQQEQAFRLVRNLLPELSDPAELKLTYLCLAEIAKSQSDRQLESAALERMLELDPSDADIRFRIAYLYGQMENRRLAVYHYKLRLDQGTDATSLNNLAVNYRVLELPGSEIAAFEKASEDDLLPKANLSHAYVDRGFLAKGEELADEVMRSNAEQIARERAMAALSRISAIRTDEKETVEKIMNGAKAEKMFRSAFASAFMDSVTSPINGEFQTPHGRILCAQRGDQLIGEGTFEEKQSSGLFGLLPENTQAEVIKVRTIKFVADMVGRSGRYKLETKEMLKNHPWDIPKTEAVHGLLIVADDGRSLEILEEQDKGFTIYTAKKMEKERLVTQ